MVSIIKELQNDMQQIKNAQLLAGDGWIIYRTATLSTWDINATLTWPESRRWKITFTPDVDKLVVTSIDFSEDNEATVIISGTDLYRHFVSVPNSLNEWYYTARLDTSTDADEAVFRAKFIVSSTSPGTISITAL